MISGNEDNNEDLNKFFIAVARGMSYSIDKMNRRIPSRSGETTMIRLFFFLSGCAIFYYGPLSYTPQPISASQNLHQHVSTKNANSVPVTSLSK